MKKGDKVKCIDTTCGTITYGKVYEVLAEHMFGNSHSQILGIRIIDDEGREGNYYQYRFELVESTNLEDDIKKATSLLGKKVEACRNTYNVISFSACTELSRDASVLTIESFNKNGYVVVLYTTDGCNFPVSVVKLAPDMIELPLTDDYTAKVYVDRVVVGCQTITKETFDKVAVAFESLNTNS